MIALRRIDTWVVIAILASALALRVLYVLVTRDAVPQIDAIDYDVIARSLAAGDGFPDTTLAAGGGPSALRPPAYPVLLAALYLIADDTVVARLAQALIGTATVALIGVLAHQALGRRAALLAMAIAAAYPSMIVTDAALLSEVLFVPLALGALAAALAGRAAPAPVRWAALAGLLLGAAVLTRPNGALLLIPVLAALLGGEEASRRTRARAAMVAGLTTVLVVLPWVVRNSIEFGRVMGVSTQAGLLAGTYNDEARTDPRNPGAWRPPVHLPEYRALFADPRLDEAELDAELRRRTLEYAREHPGYVVTATLHNALRMLHFGSPEFEAFAAHDRNIPGNLTGPMRWSFWMLAALALAGTLMGAARAVPWHLWAAAGLFFVSGAVVAGLIRYRTVADPLLILPAAQALLVLSRARGRGGRARRPGPPSP